MRRDTRTKKAFIPTTNPLCTLLLTLTASNSLAEWRTRLGQSNRIVPRAWTLQRHRGPSHTTQPLFVEQRLKFPFPLAASWGGILLWRKGARIP